MPSVKEHYKKLLARHYSWIQGGAEGQLSANRAFFRRHIMAPGDSAVAVDLGAGPGSQSIPLAEMGFLVNAIDTSRELLEELRQRAVGLPIVTIQDDLLRFARHCPPQAALVVCMGDTLTHLDTLQEVRRLIRAVPKRLAVGGRLFLGFRDMSTALEDLERFVAVRSDANRIFTCFLEYEKRHVKVHDLLHERCDDQWILHKSYYRKLRISTQWLVEQIEKAGLTMEHVEVQNGMTTLIARKP